MVEAILDRPQPQPAHADERSVSDKLYDEAHLLTGSAQWIWSGVRSGFNDMYEHPGHALSAFAMGVGAGLLTMTPYGRLCLYGLSAVGALSLAAPSATAVWRDRRNLEQEQQSLGTRLGETLAYSLPAGLGSYAGVRAAQVDWRGVLTRAKVAIGGEEPGALALNQATADKLFSSDSAGVVNAQKQHYPVRFDRITESSYNEPNGMRIDSLETVAQGRPGELVTAADGKFLATRVTAGGQTVTENGHPVIWSIKPEKIARAYDVSPEQIASSKSFTAWTKTDGPVVQMLPLHGNTSIEAWGTTLTTQARPQPSGFFGQLSEVASGRPLGWLSHYGPGDNAIVSPTQFSQTYEIVLPPLWPAATAGTITAATGYANSR